MKLLDNIFFYISVPTCVCCGKKLKKSELALCNDCYISYENLLKRNCSICNKPLNRCSCTNKHLDAHYIHKMIKVFRYLMKDEVLPTNNLIYSLKRENRKDVLTFLCDELHEAISASIDEPSTYIFTSVPRRRKAIVKYGMDHAQILAEAVAKKSNATYVKTIISNAKIEQKKSGDRIERIKNADFKLKNESIDLHGKNVILIDDIVTTGASMGTCAMLLKSAGAGKIIGACVAIAYKDAYTPLDKSDRFYKKK